MEDILMTYYEDNAKRLHNTVDKILLKFGGLSDKDKDDFYSLANEVFVDVMRQYDKSQPFDAFLYSCLLNRIKTEITRRNREKRKTDRMSVSLDAPLDDDENLTLGDVLVDDFSIEREIFEKNEDGYSNRMRAYLSRLSELQRRVLKLNAAGYLSGEIKEELHIDDRQYAECNSAIHSYRNISVLFYQ